MKTNYKLQFHDCTKKDKVEVLKKLENSDLKIGNIVTFTNEFGVQFEDVEILGFRNNTDFLPDRCAYLNNSSCEFA